MMKFILSVLTIIALSLLFTSCSLSEAIDLNEYFAIPTDSGSPDNSSASNGSPESKLGEDLNDTSASQEPLVSSPSASDSLSSSSLANQLSSLENLRWQYRIIVINNVTHSDDVINQLITQETQINERDIVWCVLDNNNIVSNYSVGDSNAFVLDFIDKTRLHYRLSSQQVILIGKDGGVKSRDSAFDLDKIFADIDVMPMRRNEMRRQDLYY